MVDILETTLSNTISWKNMIVVLFQFANGPVDYKQW